MPIKIKITDSGVKNMSSVPEDQRRILNFLNHGPVTHRELVNAYAALIKFGLVDAGDYRVIDTERGVTSEEALEALALMFLNLNLQSLTIDGNIEAFVDGASSNVNVN